MKKVRIMLAAIVVLGSVGGALAFKAKTFSPDRYCYKTNSPGVCTATVTNFSAPANPNIGTYYYTKTTNVANCLQLNCPNRVQGFVNGE